MSWLAIDSFEKTEGGLDPIIRSAKFLEQNPSYDWRKMSLLLCLGVMLVLCFSRVMIIRSDGHGLVQQDSPSLDKQSLKDEKFSPMILIPNLHPP
jgi:hypothetical protein